MQFRRTLFQAGTALLLFAGGTFLFLRPTHAGSRPAMPQTQYSAAVSKTYQYPFGSNKPFSPSYASTQSGQFIQPGAFPTAEYCGHCHQASYHQWRASLHSNSFREPYYIKNVDLLKRTKGVAYARHCEACHNPIALLSGSLTPDKYTHATWYNNEGVTCSVCHSIAEVKPTYGIGSYVMGTPSALLDANGKPIPGEVPYSEIMAHVQRHVAAVMKPFYKSPQYCAACHEADLPRTLNHYKWLPAITLYDEWQHSSFSHQSPLPFYTKPHLVCQNCHMDMVRTSLPDDSKKDGMILSHRWIGGNTAVPAYFHEKKQYEDTVKNLQHDRLNVDLFAVRLNHDQQWTGPLGSTNFMLKPGDNVQLAVVIQNKGIGHSLVPEQRDILESWVQFIVKDAHGRIVMNSGGILPNGYVDPNAHSFVAQMLDAQGHLLQHHEVWLKHTNAIGYTIQSGSSTLVRYQFQIPKGDPGPFTVTAKVNYRHFDQAFANWVLGVGHKPLPVTVMAARTRTLYLGQNKPVPPQTGDNPDWMRWNDFGITLLLQQQYGEAVYAFEQVAKLRPDYDRAWANIGIAYYDWEKYPQAAQYLAKALAMNPDSARTLYWQALTFRNQGKVPEAIADLKQAATRFPLSSDIHRELGFSYYQQHEYKLAEVQYQAVQSINPNDLAAHYILGIVYSRLGNHKEAAKQEKLFADQKLDPMADIGMQTYYAKHPAIADEAVPWHVHTEAEAMQSWNSPTPSAKTASPVAVAKGGAR
jgi:tetratricopeptide (TPR) repeat protein